MGMAVGERKTTLAPLLNVRDGVRAVAFYKAAFGAEEIFVLDDAGGVVAHLSIEGAEFWLADESPQHQNPSPDAVGGCTVRMVLTVEDPDSVFARAVAAGAQILSPVEDQSYRWRVGRLVDPFGHHWEIGKPLS
jgi:PhnB protein